MESASFLQFIDIDGIPAAVAILVVGLVLLRIVTRTLDRLGERLAERRLLLKQVSALVRFAAWFLLLLGTASSVLVLRSEALLAIAGSLGVAFGFAFKDLLASLMAGVILLFDRPFQVGDRVSYGGYYGEVKVIGLRSVRLVTLDDNLVTVPNSNFLSHAVASANAGALDCMVVVPVYVAAAEDFTRARDLVEEAAFTSPWVYLEKPVVTLISDEFLGERFVTVIRLKAYVIDARFEKTFASDVTQRVKSAFREAGIRTPDAQYRDLELNQGRELPSGPTALERSGLGAS
jgi:small-conductance mechanosensitive channel